MSKQIRPSQAAVLTVLVLAIMIAVRALGRVGRSLRTGFDDVAGPTMRAVSDLVDGPSARR